VNPSISITPELTLRVLRPYEAEAIFMLVQRNREHLREWLPWVDSTRSPIDSRRFLEMSYAGFLSGEGFSFGILSQGTLVGVVGFHGFDRMNRVTSLGYWLAKDYCRQGIMRQSVAACIDFAIREQDMNRVYIRCAEGNTVSKRIPEALGFKLEGIQREAEWLYDHFVNLKVYSLLAAEWKSSFSAFS
jgi:ribosomal-protein-serine acetyltransferase